MLSSAGCCCVIVALCVLLAHTEANQSPLLTTGLNALERMLLFFRRESRSSQDDGRNYPDTPGKKILRQGTYDFIVIGAGTAGSVVANRLSENPAWKILLLEAGRDETILNEIPVLTPFFALTDYDWGYVTEPQSNACLAMKERRCVWPRGKALGGSSTINYMIYSRGHRLDYDEWAQLGNKGWSYADVLPYFKKSENAQIPELKNSKYHSSGGYLVIENAPYHTELGRDFLEAGVKLGYNITSDYNGEQETGFAHNQVLMHNGLRCSASKSFLRPIRHRSNLHLSLNSRVSKILVDPVTKQTIGVEFIKNRLLYRVKVNREVVLSAGALNSPQLLMLSGIGPKDHLTDLGIPVIKDLKVGYNLQDHVNFLGLTFLVNEKAKLAESRAQHGQTFLKYVVNGTGLMTSAGTTESLAFVRTKYAEDERPDIELLFITAGLNSDGGGPLLTKGLGITLEFYDQVYRSIDKKDVWGIIPIILHPKSRGVLKLKDTNPFHHPLIDPQLFSDPYDLKVLVEGIKIALKVADNEVFQKFDSRLHNVSVPGCREFVFGSDNYWECACTYLTGASHHQLGTCKMGPASDKDAVVDPELRVYGIKGLRVADTSVIPLELTGHTTATAYMIGEKVSDLIKKSWA